MPGFSKPVSVGKLLISPSEPVCALNVDVLNVAPAGPLTSVIVTSRVALAGIATPLPFASSILTTKKSAPTEPARAPLRPEASIFVGGTAAMVNFAP